MRKIIVLSFISLDGVLQGPGSPEEDTSGGFQYGGWIAPYSDDVLYSFLQKQMQPADLLLGRKTFQIWEDYWPKHEAGWPGINEVNKHVVSKTIKHSAWKNSVFLDDVEEVKKLKQSEGSNLQVWGSGNLIQTLLAHDLVDELSVKIFPVTLGKGKRLFEDGSIPAAFRLTESLITPKGVIIAHYQRAGNVETGNVGE